MQKIRIAICDDELIIRRKLLQIVHNILQKEDIFFELIEFASGIDLIEQSENIDVAFLDIEMPELDGIKTGTRMKQKNSDCQIIIASGREDRFKETYQLKAVRFISKPYNEEEIKESLQAYLNEYQLGIEKIEVFKDRNSYWIRQRDIEYISAFDSSVVIMADGVMYRKQVSIKKIEELLDLKIFFKIHKSHIVNLYHVVDFTDKEVIMKNKTKIPIARRQRKEFEQIYMMFDIKYR